MPTPSYILGYGVVSAAGLDSRELWHALREGRDSSREIDTQKWPVSATARVFAYTFPDSFFSGEARSTLSAEAIAIRGLKRAWKECLDMLPEAKQKEILHEESLGIILASTKGLFEDFVWQNAPQPSSVDPLNALLESFLRASELRVAEENKVCISNACASSLAAVALGQKWLARGQVKRVLILGADLVGAFVLQGFQTLRALSEDKARPFAADRSGLRLGEATTALLLGSDGEESLGLEIEEVGLDSEGYSLTRPRADGGSLRRACARFADRVPDLVIAHGTSTTINDQTEDLVFREILTTPEKSPITATKWCVGHTLGASASIDLIVAALALQEQSSFAIANTSHVDPEFKAHYLSRDRAPTTHPLEKILVTSLGFGGVHAATIVKKAKALGAAKEIKTQSFSRELRLAYDEFRYTFPATTEARWKDLCERWYQLDAPAYGLAEAYSTWTQDQPHRFQPKWILSASGDASNETDFAFAQGGALSPAKFVHTLPNVRLSPLSQVSGFKGHTLCVQKGESSLVAALREGAQLALEQSERVWVLSVSKETQLPSTYIVKSFYIDPTAQTSLGWKLRPSLETCPTSPSDFALSKWLHQAKESFSLGRQMEIICENIPPG